MNFGRAPPTRFRTDGWRIRAQHNASHARGSDFRSLSDATGT
jgi:hypothetical protein